MNNIFLKKILTFIIIIIMLFTLLIGINKLISFDNNNRYSLHSNISYIKDAIIVNPINNIKEIFNNILNFYNIKQENFILRQQIDDISSINQYNKILLEEIERLKQLNKLSDDRVTYDSINASIISHDFNVYYDYITIDVGTNDHIDINMPIINNKGLIGKVINVSKDTSIVSLLTNNTDYNKVSIKIKQNDGNYCDGILEGYNKDSNNYLVKILNSKIDISK